MTTEQKSLSGIERELVLKYLVDGNVPVTITPIEENTEDSEEIRAMNSEVFSISLQGENVSVLKEGIILLQDVPDSVLSFKGKLVKVEFYFNRVGLYFITEMKSVSSGPALVIPNLIYKIQEIEVQRNYDFSALLYYSVEIGKEFTFSCLPAFNFELFSRPIWSSIPLDSQQKAKELLEKYVHIAHDNGRAGNGIQLISICRYLVQKKIKKVQAIQGLLKPFDILFINHERIVLGFEENDIFMLNEGAEYALKMSFSLKASPAITRDVFVTCRIDTVYSEDVDLNQVKQFVADCSFTSLKEEDCRFLYEKATSSLFT